MFLYIETPYQTQKVGVNLTELIQSNLHLVREFTFLFSLSWVFSFTILPEFRFTHSQFLSGLEWDSTQTDLPELHPNKDGANHDL